jgi:hypothetical protein
MDLSIALGPKLTGYATRKKYPSRLHAEQNCILEPIVIFDKLLAKSFDSNVEVVAIEEKTFLHGSAANIE